ncbi:MAG: hypothetical protein ACJ75H_00175 [Thermoanaerobaculia bacterium]
MQYSRFTVPSLFAGLALLLIPAVAPAQCKYTGVPTAVDMPSTYPTCVSGDPNVRYNVNTSANDYAALYFDAKNPGCAAAALTVFQDKLRNNLNYAESGGLICDPRKGFSNPFQPALGGAMIGSIYATAVAFLDGGYALDDSLMVRVREQHRGFPSPQDPNCGLASTATGVNSCMDDYTQTAAGFGWLAAYEARKGRATEAASWAGSARVQINKALSPMKGTGSVCFYRIGSNPPKCDADFPDVTAGTARIIGAEHNQENPSYGAGLMSSIATACRGMAIAGRPCNDFNANEVKIARDLFLHAQKKTFFDGSDPTYKWKFWPADCIRFPDNVLVTCADALIPYIPTDYPLKRFYDAVGFTTFPIRGSVQDETKPEPTVAYQFHKFYEPRYPATYNRDEFFGTLRKLFYEELGFNVWPAASPQANIYWIQPAARAGFGPAGSLTVAGGSIDPTRPVEFWWRNLSTGSLWTQVPFSPTPDPNGSPENVWYNTVPATVDPFQSYEVRVRQGTGPWFNCTYGGGNTIWWCP